VPKKGFKNVTDDNPALAFLGTQNVQAVSDEQNGQAVDDVHNIDDVHDVQSIPNVDDVQSIHDAANNHNVYHVSSIQDSHDIGDVHDVSRIHDVPNAHSVDTAHSGQTVSDVQAEKLPPVKYAHINLRVTQEAKDFLSDESWRSRMNVTQYINSLIEADMAAKARVGESDV